MSRFVSLLLALPLVASKEPPPPSASEPAAEAHAPQPSNPSAIVVGVLHRRGLYVCKEGESPDRGRWVHVHPAVGFVPLVADHQMHAGSQSLYGKVVAVHGRVSENRPLVPEPGTKTCLFPMQMRSDYVNSPDGILVQRKPAPLPAFDAERIERYDGLSARETDGGIEITFTNRLGRALPAPVVMRAHYEGCYGKPGTARVERRAPSGLKDGTSFTATFPRLEMLTDRPERRQVHALASIEVDASGDKIWFDLDVSIATLGIDVSCKEFR